MATHRTMLPSSNDDDKGALFRSGPGEIRRSRLTYSDPYIERPRKRLTASVIICFTVVSFGGFIAMSSYTQTTSVYGHVTGNDGITRLKAHQAGVVAKVKVKEGEKVSKGDLLFEITADRELGSKSSLASKISGEIGRRLAASETEMRANDALADLADREIKAKSVWMKKDLSRRREELALMHESIGVSENLLSRLRSAADEHLILSTPR